MSEESQFEDMYKEMIKTYRPSTGALAEEQKAAFEALKEPIENDYEARERFDRWCATSLPRDPTIGQDPTEEAFSRAVLTERGHEMFRSAFEDDVLLRAFFEEYASSDKEIRGGARGFMLGLAMCGKVEKKLFREFVSRLSDLNIEGLNIKHITRPMALWAAVNVYKRKRDEGSQPPKPGPGLD